MRPFSCLFAACLTAVAIAGCSDNARQLLAPTRSDVLVPVYDPHAYDFVEISAGAHHTCARMKSGPTYCWGGNGYGQIGVPSSATCGLYGYGLVSCVPQPTRVSKSSFITGSSFTVTSSISTGADHTCAISGGAVWCWGYNASGQVGNGRMGDYSNVLTPTQVSGTVTYVAVAAGERESCGITDTHLLNCWGANAFGITPTLYSNSAIWGGKISMGSEHACALNLLGWWGCWGSNDNGQIGADPRVWPVLQGPMSDPATTNSSRVREGVSFTCADQANGTVQCLGKNDVGQLGNRRFRDAFSVDPQTVGLSTGLALNNVTAGAKHACALDPSGAAWCWGDNSHGELGSGVAGGVGMDPMPVAGGLVFRDIAAGGDHTCAIGTDNHIYCWGDNYYGQLGQPSAPLHGQTTPVRAVDP